MSDIEILILLLLVALFLFDWYVLSKIYDFEWNIHQIKSRYDTVNYIQNEIIKILPKHTQDDDLNNGKKTDD